MRKNLDTVLNNAAWYYPNPKDAAKEIKDHVAFCKWRWGTLLEKHSGNGDSHNNPGQIRIRSQLQPSEASNYCNSQITAYEDGKCPCHDCCEIEGDLVGSICHASERLRKKQRWKRTTVSVLKTSM